jgi:enoyl-CoA hydratase
VRLPRLVGAGRAMDLVLTGREVTAQEALRIGLVDRVVPSGAARQRAEELAHRLSELPQVCLQQDRLSLIEQEGMSEAEAMRNELGHGLVSLQADALEGAQRFAAGEGRHGAQG